MIDKNKVKEVKTGDSEFAFRKSGLFGDSPLRIRTKQTKAIGGSSSMFFLSADESKSLYNFLDEIYGTKKKDK